MRKLAATLVVVTILVVWLPGSAGASSRARAPKPVPAALADRDGDHVSDGLQIALSNARPSDLFHVVATFDRRASADAARRGARQLAVSRTFHLIPGFAGDMTASQIRGMARAPGVVRLEEQATFHATSESANRDFGTARARADFGVDGTGVQICVVDTGADAAHEQLDGSKIVGWKDFIADAATPYDDHGHGTHVLSIAAGDGTGGALADRFKGVAPKAQAYVTKVLDGSGNGTEEGVIAGIQWCADTPEVDVISMSLGTAEGSDGGDAVSQAVDAAVTAKGKLVVVAAGNSGDMPGSVGSPGAALHAITVGSVAEHSAAPSAFYHSDGMFLDFFSSRGPTLGNLTKPDVMAPGDSILAAQAGTAATYVAYSGTSMATPFVAGTLALARQRNGALDEAGARALLDETSQDRGPVGKDNDWGAGLLDGYALVARAGGTTTYTPTTFPTNRSVTGNVANNGTWTYTFALTSGDLSTPIAATIVLDGTLNCVLGSEPWCFAYEWGPDLDAELLDPTGAQIAVSTCAAGSECGVGRQETLHAMPTVAGTYTIHVVPFEGEPNNGQGGSFRMDLSTGPVGAAPPPPPPPNYHVGDLDGARATTKGGWRATVTIAVHDASHAPAQGIVVTGSWSTGGSSTCTTGASGTCSVSVSLNKKKASTKFTVTQVNGGTPAGGHDPDGDSDGKAITVLRP